MKKGLFVAALSAQLTTQLFAGGDIAPVEVHEPKAIEHEAESKFYVIAKALIILGDKVNHGPDVVLDGDKDYGYGIDIGYRLGNGFALEYDFSYARNTVTEDDGHTIEKATGTYYTHALDLVYTYEFTHTFGVFAKAGYEYEIEKIEDFHIDNDGTGFNYGIGVEAAVNHKYKLVAEYEHATIEGPRGDSLFVGVMYNF